jgi:hypothetical protein
MMHEYLNQFDSKTAAAILAEAALATSPIPEFEGTPYVAPYGPEVATLLSAAREQLHISESDSSPDAKIKLDNFLSRALYEFVFAHVDKKEVIKKAGAAGRLLPSEYSVNLPPAMSVFYRLGVRPNHVEDAILNPDVFQHLMTSPEHSTDLNRISLFVKRTLGKSAADGFHLLVQTLRSGAVHTAQAAWRIYIVDIGDLPVASPLDLLRAFVVQFGIPFTVDGKPYEFLESSEFPRGKPVNISFPPTQPEYFFTASSKMTGEEIFEVGIVYGINLRKYAENLKRHRAIAVVPNFTPAQAQVNQLRNHPLFQAALRRG